MRKFSTRALLTAAAIAVTAASVPVGVTLASGMKHGGDHEARAGQFFDRLDADKDGRITREEADQFRANVFSSIDSDGDGKISQAEYTAHRIKKAEERAQSHFARLDGNNDGALESNEYPPKRMGKGKGKRGDMFSRFDSNDDGVVTREEMQEKMKKRHEHRRDRDDD